MSKEFISKFLLYSYRGLEEYLRRGRGGGLNKLEEYSVTAASYTVWITIALEEFQFNTQTGPLV
jgi:hypothetical protein